MKIPSEPIATFRRVLQFWNDTDVPYVFAHLEFPTTWPASDELKPNELTGSLKVLFDVTGSAADIEQATDQLVRWGLSSDAVCAPEPLIQAAAIAADLNEPATYFGARMTSFTDPFFAGQKSDEERAAEVAEAKESFQKEKDNAESEAYRVRAMVRKIVILTNGY